MPAGGHPGQQPQARRGLLPGRRAPRTRGRAAGDRQARQDRRRPGRPRCCSPSRAVRRGRRRRAWRSPRSAAPTRPSSTRSGRSASSTRCSTGPRRAGRRGRVPQPSAMPGAVVADLKIARGLDYYTGTVYETQLVGYEDFGSICSGGRYDALASDGTLDLPRRRHLAGRLAPAGRPARPRAGHGPPARCPRCVLVAVTDEAGRVGVRAPSPARCAPAGSRPRWRPRRDKFGKQIRHADRRGIPFVWFPGRRGRHSVKDIRSGDQVPADPALWTPPARGPAPAHRAHRT